MLIIISLLIIPKKEEAIRIRVIASSNSLYDQNVKMDVKDNVMSYLSDLLKESTNVKESRKIINNNLTNISNKVSNILEKYGETYDINYGNNFFPKKTYNNLSYDEGYYESLVIKIGEGKGDNWWCFIFPPFCFVDTKPTNTKKVEYKSYFKEIISNLFK